MNLNDFFTTLRQKFFIVILAVIVCSIALGAEKYFTVDTSTRLSADAFVQYLVRLDTPSDAPIIVESRPFFITSSLLLYKFIESSSADFDYSNFNGEWEKFSDIERVWWLGGHLSVERFDHNLYVFSFRVGADERPDYEYVRSNIPRFLDAYCDFARLQCSKLGVGELVVLEREKLIPEPVTVSRRPIVFKYMIVGAVLGLIAGLILVLGLSARSSRNV